MVQRPGSGRTGGGWNDPGDASAFIGRTIHAIASRPEREAEGVLKNLIDNHAPSYADTAKEALAFQRMTRRDHEHVIPTVAELQELITDAADWTTPARGRVGAWQPCTEGRRQARQV